MANFYSWLRGDRAKALIDAPTAAVSALDAKPIIPLWKCTAVGGPAKCRYHSRFLRKGGATGQFADPVKVALHDRDDEVDQAGGMGELIDAESEAILDGMSDGSRYQYDPPSRALYARISDAVGKGVLAPIRMPATSMQNGRIDGIPNWLYDIYHVLSGMNIDYDGFVEDDWTDDNNAIEDNELRMFAQEAGVWVGDAKKAVKRELINRHKLGAGQESCVYDADDSVVKVMDISAFRRSPRRAIESIMLFNFYFPESAQEVLGIGENEEGHTCLILGQRRIQASRKRLKLREKLDFMRQRGFHPIPSYLKSQIGTSSDVDADEVESAIADGRVKDAHAFMSKDGSIAIYDLHKGNIKRTVDGEIVVLDAFPELNSAVCGGSYDIEHPPKRLFANKEMKRIQREIKQMRRNNPLTAEDEAVGSVPRIVIRHPTTPLPDNPYYDPEKIARLDAEPKVPFEELREIARLDAIENPPEGRFIRNYCIADLVARQDRTSEHRRAFLAAHPDPRERLQFIINKIKADRARLAAEKAARL